ncbi:MAG: hypothetical protein ACR2N4_13135 [Jatrophihabitans sp.]
MELAPDNQIVVTDGESFAIDYDPDQPGAYHFAGWQDEIRSTALRFASLRMSGNRSNC